MESDRPIATQQRSLADARCCAGMKVKIKPSELGVKYVCLHKFALLSAIRSFCALAGRSEYE